MKLKDPLQALKYRNDCADIVAEHLYSVFNGFVNSSYGKNFELKFHQRHLKGAPSFSLATKNNIPLAEREYMDCFILSTGDVEIDLEKLTVLHDEISIPYNIKGDPSDIAAQIIANLTKGSKIDSFVLVGSFNKYIYDTLNPSYSSDNKLSQEFEKD